MVKRMDYEFKSLKELYNRIKPALTSKRIELNKIGFKYVKEADIWNYLTNTKWQTTTGLSISEMVNDIFNVNEEALNEFVVSKVSKENRNPYFDE